MNASLKRLASREQGQIITGNKRIFRQIERTVTVGKANGESLGFRLPLADVCCGIPDPAPVATHVGRELHVRYNCSHVSIFSTLVVETIISP
jgi:hypothetical protein